MAYTEFTCRSGGSNLYAGTLDGSAEASTTPLVTYTNGGWNSGTGVFTPASGNPVSAGVAVGNWVSVYTDAASAPTGFVARVTAVSSTTITLSTTAKIGTAPTTAGTGITAVVGGAWVGPTAASGFPLSLMTSAPTNTGGNYPRVNLKSDQTYSITAGISLGAGPYFVQGYTTTFGDGGRATIDGGTTGASFTPLTISGSLVTVRDVIVQNNGATGTATGVSVGTASQASRVKVSAVRGAGITAAGNAALMVECEVTAANQSNTATLGGFLVSSAAKLIRCVAHDNTGGSNRGFRVNGQGASLIGCISDTNGATGVEVATSGVLIEGGAIYGNGGAGVTVGSGNSVAMESAVMANNATYGVNVTAGGLAQLTNCAYRSNSSGQTTGPTEEFSPITLTADPFTDAPNRNFALNTTAGGGAACRGLGRGTFPPSDPTVGYPDVGAAQHQDAGGGGVIGSRIFTGY